MYPIPPSEQLVEERKCRQCSAEFPITDKDMEFYEKLSPVFPIASFGKEVPRNEAEDFPVSESTKLLITEWKVKILETEAGNPSPEIAGTPFQKGAFLIPPPTLCPDCRQQRRLSFRNERKLYKRKCDATGKDIISVYSPISPFTVYEQEYWWSDDWDPIEYGREFDFSRSAFEQFSDLLRVVPRPSLFNTNSENSEYTQTCTDNKNTYMLFESSFDEDCLYGHWLHYADYCVDCSFCDRSHQCYECLDCMDCHALSFSVNCEDCRESSYLKDCIGCSNCFGCQNLQNQQFHFFNVAYPEREYRKKVENFMKVYPTKSERDDIISAFFQKWIHRINQIHQSENCTGDYIRNGKNCHSCFYVFENAENAKYMCNTWLNALSVMDGDAVGANGSYIYESINTALESSNNIFCIRCWWTQYGMYQNECDNTTHCFLCVGLDRKSYCILNRQYTKEAYESLVPQIIEKMMVTPLRQGFEGQMEWGEFFPASMSPFGYNETVAQEYFPLSREEVLGKTPLKGGDAEWNEAEGVGLEKSDSNPPVSPLSGGSNNENFLHWHAFNWSDYEAPFPKVEKVIPASKLPNEITKIPDDILNWAIECEVSRKPFRIIKQELEFYRKHNLPIPRRHPDIRHMDRMKMRNPRKLFERRCDCERCEENWKKKWVILREGVDASYFFLEEKIQGNSGTERRNPPSITTETGDWHLLSKGGLRKKMITTYSPERPERVYCEVCYERETI